MISALALFYERFVDFIITPYVYPEMRWIVIPLILVLILTEIYFGRYKFEELGWNTAYSNSLVLLFVGMDLIRFLYAKDLLFPLTIESSLVFALIIIGVFLVVSNLSHFLPKEFTFAISSALPLNLVACITVVLVYSDIPLDFTTFLVLLTFVVLASLLVKFVWFLIPETFEKKT